MITLSATDLQRMRLVRALYEAGLGRWQQQSAEAQLWQLESADVGERYGFDPATANLDLDTGVVTPLLQAAEHAAEDAQPHSVY